MSTLMPGLGSHAVALSHSPQRGYRQSGRGTGRRATGWVRSRRAVDTVGTSSVANRGLRAGPVRTVACPIGLHCSSPSPPTPGGAPAEAARTSRLGTPNSSRHRPLQADDSGQRGRSITQLSKFAQWSNRAGLDRDHEARLLKLPTGTTTSCDHSPVQNPSEGRFCPVFPLLTVNASASRIVLWER